MKKLRIIMLVLSLSPATAAHAQTAVPALPHAEGAASPNPFSEPLSTLNKMIATPPGQPTAPIMPPLPPPVVSAGTPQVVEGEMEPLSVQYISGDEGLLYSGGGEGARTYRVRHNIRTRIGARWVMPEIVNGVVFLYQDSQANVVNGKGKGRGRGQLLWSGSVAAATVPVPSSGAGTDVPQAFGTTISSPSQRSMAAGNALITPATTR